jgi:hypothetical protein
MLSHPMIKIVPALHTDDFKVIHKKEDKTTPFRSIIFLPKPRSALGFKLAWGGFTAAR